MAVQVVAQVKTEEITIGLQAHQGKVLVVEQVHSLPLVVLAVEEALLRLVQMARLARFAVLVAMD